MKRLQAVLIQTLCIGLALGAPVVAQNDPPPESAPAKPSETAQPSEPAQPAEPAEAVEPAPAAHRGVRSALQPPDGKWLKDKDGREYFVNKVSKPKGFRRDSDSHITISGTFGFDIVGEDADFFFAKVYKNVVPAPQGRLVPTAAQLAAKAKEYEFTLPDTERIVFEPIGEGLPTTGHWRNGFDLADLNGDGHLDFVHSSARGQLNSRPNLFLGDGKGGFSPWAEARYPSLKYEYGDIVATDFNGDGFADLAIGVHLRGVVVLYGNGKGQFRQAPSGPSYESGDIRLEAINRFSSRKLVRLDWDGDGRPEFLAVAEGPSGVFFSKKGFSGRLQESYGVGLFHLDDKNVWTRIAGKTDPNLYGDSVTLGDFNGDGKIDFAIGSNSAGVESLIHLQQEDGTWAAAPPLPLRDRSWVRAVAAGDFNGDGRLDLAATFQVIELGVHRVGLDLLLAKPEGVWQRRLIYAEPGDNGIQAVTAGDIDADGHLDLIAGTRNGRVFVLLGDGTGGFSRESADELSAVQACGVYDIELADLNEDKRTDLTIAFAGEECPGQGHIGVWEWTPSRR